jgi:predicted dehydrogenase
MINRRSFLVSPGLTAALAGSAMGANDRVRVGVIGVGVRGSYMAPVFASNPDCEVVSICDVFAPAREKTNSALPAPVEAVVDYRRILERKDVDAVLIATPDHWHAPMVIEAAQAGKDAYCEKPLSNNIEAAASAVDAAKQYGRIVQIGLQQRSWEHFQMCQKWVREGRYGTIYCAQMHWQGYYSTVPQTPTPPPADLDWDLFQGPAPRKPYSVDRQRNWRGYYDYGGGIITDQGVHLCDLVRWYMDAGQPLSVAASAQWVRVPIPNRDQPPDTFAINWKYDNFVLSFANTQMPGNDVNMEHGVYFYGTTGVLHVSRSSYTARPLPVRVRQGQTAPAPPFEPVNEHFRQQGQPADRAHVRNFLDCVKSRQKPVTDIETGFNSSLPLLLGVMAIRNGREYNWNGSASVACG